MPKMITTPTLLNTSDDEVFQDLRLVCSPEMLDTLVGEFTQQFSTSPSVQIYDWGHSARFQHGYIVLECGGGVSSDLEQQVLHDPRITAYLVSDLPEVLTEAGTYVKPKKVGAHYV